MTPANKILHRKKSKSKVYAKNDEPVVFETLYDACKVEFFCKDGTPIINQYFAVCEITYSGFGEKYVGKTKIIYFNDVLNTRWVIKTIL